MISTVEDDSRHLMRECSKTFPELKGAFLPRSEDRSPGFRTDFLPGSHIENHPGGSDGSRRCIAFPALSWRSAWEQ